MILVVPLGPPSAQVSVSPLRRVMALPARPRHSHPQEALTELSCASATTALVRVLTSALPLCTTRLPCRCVYAGAVRPARGDAEHDGPAALEGRRAHG